MAGGSPYLSIITFNFKEINSPIKRQRVGLVQWLMPRWADHLKSGVQDKSGQHGETLSLLKIQ